MRQKNKKKKTKWDFGKIVTVAILVCILVFMLYNLAVFLNKSTIQTYIIDIGDVKSTTTKEMVIIKDEKVFYAPSDGHFELIFPEGEKVKKGVAIAKTKNQSVNENYRYLIELISARIDSIENNQTPQNSENELSKINNRLDYLYKEVQNRIYTGDVAYIDILKKEILSLNDKKQYLVHDSDGTYKSLEELKLEKAELEAQLKNVNSVVYSNYIGILSTYYDGYEDSLKTSNLNELSVSMLNSIKERPPVDYSKPKLKGDPLGRIVSNFKWYMACEITKDDIEHIYTEKPVNIYVEDKKIKAFLEDFHKDEDGKFVGYFRIEDEGFNFYEKRRHTAELEYEFSQGLKIPNSSLVEIDGKQGVFIVDRTGTAVFKEIESIECKNDTDFAIKYEATYTKNSKKINLYDEVILNPENIVEGQKVK